jgi:hypothetical protein
LGLTASKGLTASWRPKALLLALRVRQGIAKFNFILGLVELRASFVEEREPLLETSLSYPPARPKRASFGR